MLYGRQHTRRTGRLLGTDPPHTFEARLDDAEARGRPALLALHGFTGTVSELLPLVRGVADAGFAVRAPLLPGHGTHPADLQSVTFAELVAFARAELAALVARHGGRVVVLGFSYGSLVAATLAADAPPPELAGLAVLGNAIALPLHSRGPLGAMRRAGLAVPDAYLGKPFVADLRDRAAARAVATYDRHPLRAAMEVYLAGRATRDLLPRIQVPSLVLHGAHDRVCPKANAARFARAVASTDVTVRVYRRSAHLLAVDHDRAEVLDDVLEFLRRL